MEKKTYHICYRCYYANGTSNDHHRDGKLSEIPKWIEAYLFTHPLVESISVKIWMTNEE